MTITCTHGTCLLDVPIGYKRASSEVSRLITKYRLHKNSITHDDEYGNHYVGRAVTFCPGVDIEIYLINDYIIDNLLYDLASITATLHLPNSTEMKKKVNTNANEHAVFLFIDRSQTLTPRQFSAVTTLIEHTLVDLNNERNDSEDLIEEDRRTFRASLYETLLT